MAGNKNVVSFVLIVLCCCLAKFSTAQTKRPNIIVIYADDLGYGDLSCYGATKISTPNIDALAAKGMRFTNAHATSSTCTPSRFSMLTGKYAWRQKGTGIADGDSPLIIPTKSLTLPGMLKNAGYKTAVVGKWHLGLGGAKGPEWNKDLKPGPLEVGFDYCYIIPATADRVPCVFVENYRVVDLDPNDPIGVDYHSKIGNDPTGYENPEKLKIKADNQHNNTIVDSISRIGFMTGGTKARWTDEDIAARLTNKALSFIGQQQRDPFFLYLSTHDIHVPRSPNARFLGKSSMGLRGDAILQLDWMVGELTAYLKAKGLLDNTIIIFSSDNGPILEDGYADEARQKSVGHQPAGPYRGGKYSTYEGGTRVPFIVHWPSRVKPGVSVALLSQVDLFASFAKLSGQKLSPQEAPDSFDMSRTLLGDTKSGRNWLVGHAMNNKLSLIHHDFKYIEEGQELYNLKSDPAEKNNLNGIHQKEILKMISRLDAIKKGH